MCYNIAVKGCVIMPVSKKQQASVNKYVKENYDRINVTFPKGSKEALKAHAQNNGESVNAFINRAVMEVTEMDNMHTAYQRSLLRQLERIKEAIDGNDFATAKKSLDDLVEDTKSNIGK